MQRIEAMHISAVELDTGLTKDNLRMWERRYGFPVPLRDAHGERVYPREQVEKLRLIRRLMDGGFRPHTLMNATVEDLRRMGAKHRAQTPPTQRFIHETRTLVQTVKTRDMALLRARLRWQLVRLGIRSFVMDLVAALNEAVGDAWAQGEISTAEEHLYSEQVESILRAAIGQIDVETQGPRVLITTMQGEQHKIGVLMLEALLTAELASCVPLGTQTPITDIVKIAVSAEVQVVALSFSSAFPRRSALNALVELRAELPDEILIWAGGDGVKGIRRRPAGILVPMTLSSALSELERWRALGLPPRIVD